MERATLFIVGYTMLRLRRAIDATLKAYATAYGR